MCHITQSIQHNKNYVVSGIVKIIAQKNIFFKVFIYRKRKPRKGTWGMGNSGDFPQKRIQNTISREIKC